MTLSVVIIAQDEERTIGRVLDAVKSIAEEVILVDSGSSDATREIAADLGAEVIHQDWLGYAAQKNFALGLAKGDWVLSLDADEVLTAELVEEIAALLKNASAKDFL
ncbi:MAG TPA: glycosyltransferase family 2 protein, partial [Candidatus Melainabacteria bacterium]|nr:glycosyltransferase family 2 protein [Candidatus Melainabacteria bacterium]